MYAKVRISGDIEVKTGMHIGGSSAFSAIGAVDSPVILDVRSNLPMIPGSSLKGKMRSLLAKEFNEAIVEPNDDHERLTRLFGSAKKDNIKRSRVLFSDMVLDNEQELRDAGLQSMTEVKFENSKSQPPLQVVVCFSPHKGYVTARPKGRCRKHCYWSAYKAVLLKSSFLDSSACSFIYFCTASSVILPMVST